MKLVLGLLVVAVFLFLYTTYVKRTEYFTDTITTTYAGGNTITTDASGNILTTTTTTTDASGNVLATTTTDASGNVIATATAATATDASGNRTTVAPTSLIQLSLSELMALVGKTTPPPAADLQAAYTQIQPTLLTDMATAVRTGLQGSSLTAETAVPAAADTPSTDQGCEVQEAKRAFLKDYIRKDSIPCYGCSLP